MTVQVEHGYNRYTRGCRCPVCRKAKADYMRARRAAARRWAQSVTGGRYVADTDSHGTRYAYEELGCRCGSCTAARAAADARYYQASAGGAG